MTEEEKVQLFNNALAEVGHPPATRMGRNIRGESVMVIITNAAYDNAAIYQAYRTVAVTAGVQPMCRPCYERHRDVTRRPRGSTGTLEQHERGEAIKQACWRVPSCPGP